MKKIVILVSLIIFITGCSVNYSLTINEDLSITESANLTGTSTFFENYYKSTKKNVLKSFLDIYQDILNQNNYKYELKEDEIPYVTVSKNYGGVQEYIDNSILFNGYFDEIKYTENGDLKRIETVGFNENNENDPDRFDVKHLEIAIKCAYKVTDHNAKEYDSKTNTYYYELNADSANKIMLEYDVSQKYSASNELIKKIIMCAVIIVGVWVIIVLTNKNDKKKNNML